jgi:nicotinate phosphoribosyltransferase
MIIESLLDTDLYKFTMMQAVLHHFPSAQVEYQFKNRSKGVDLRPYAAEITEEIRGLCELTLDRRELDYLRGLRYLKPDFVDFLRNFKLNASAVSVTEGPDDLRIMVNGSWVQTILFEVPILSIVNEVYFRNQTSKPFEPGKAMIAATEQFEQAFAEGARRLLRKIGLIESHNANFPGIPFVFSDFGTRRRYSREWQGEVVRTLARLLPKNFYGTSNVDLAHRYGLTARGTMAHEWLQAFQQLGCCRVGDSQKQAFEYWVKEYRGDMGIALSDIMGIDAFLRDFDLYFCKLFDGVRHDSGDPYEWTEKIIAHYRAHKVDPRTKTAVYSDGLDVPKALDICCKYNGQINMAFGIGTNLTNDVGYDPLQIVMKMTRCNGQPVAKVSDARGKTMCNDEKYLAYLKQVFHIDG